MSRSEGWMLFGLRTRCGLTVVLHWRWAMRRLLDEYVRTRFEVRERKRVGEIERKSDSKITRERE